MAKIQAVRGMNDVLPEQSVIWQYVEDTIKSVLKSYGYQEIRFPVVEQTELFKRSIGEVTDIVEKEMYTFDDRNGDNLTLRPEGTACCVRAADEHGLLFNQTQRLWYMGPMFRHERPQKGRYRQFNQVGVEVFGLQGPDIDAELILQTHQLWKTLGINNEVRLEINSIGTSESRVKYGAALTEYLNLHKDKLDEDSQRRLSTNPLRILDSKSQATQEVLKNAPSLADFIDVESEEHFAKLCDTLKQAEVEFIINPCLIRGLDYYCKTVFEWKTDKLGAQDTICGGGRYDGLVKQLGGKATPGVGYAMGVERLILLLETLDVIPVEVNQLVDIYIAVIGNELNQQALTLAESIRLSIPGVRVLTHCGGGKYNNQLKKAYSSTATFALILEADEGNARQVSNVKIKHLLDDSKDDLKLTIEEMMDFFTKHY